MKKIKKILVVSLLLFGIWLTWIVKANVDQTNVFEWEYNSDTCLLDAKFNLWGHHRYEREYYIEKPGVIEIWDIKHTTVWKNLNLSIPGCSKFKLDSCQNKQFWEWKELRRKFYNFEIIGSWLNIKKEWNNIIVQNLDKKGITIRFWGDIKISNSDEIRFRFTSKWVYYTLWSYNVDKVLVFWDEKNLTNWIKNKYNLDVLEYRFSLNNNVEIIYKVFERNYSGTAKSSNQVDLYRARDGKNLWDRYCSDPKIAPAPQSGYCTDLYNWDYTQHNYTTTNIKLHPVDITCKWLETSDWKEENQFKFDDATLLSKQEPKFNTDNLTINWQDWEKGKYFINAKDGKIDFSKLRYERIGTFWKKELKVEAVEVSIKRSDDFTIWTWRVTIIPNQWEWYFKDFSVELKNTKKPKENITKELCENCMIVFSYISGWSSIATSSVKVDIIPTNTVQKEWNLQKKWGWYANGNDSYSINQIIKDEYKNKIEPETPYTSWIEVKFIWEDADKLYSDTKSFGKSTLAFNVKSLHPKNYKNIKVMVKISEHANNYQLSERKGRYKNWLEFGASGSGKNGNWNVTKWYIMLDLWDLNFKKPLVAESIEISNDNWTTWDAIPEIGREQLYKFIVKDKWALGSIVNWILWGKVSDDFKKFFNLPQWVVFKLFEVVKPKPIKLITNFNWENGLEYIFRITLWIDWEQNSSKAKNWLSISVKWLDVSYHKNWKDIKYKLDEFRTADSCPVKTLWVKLIWGGQATWDIANTTDSAANIIDMSKLDLKWDIKKSVNNIVRWLKSEAIVNRVKYVVGDVNVTWNDYFRDFETLVVRNWNVYISKDIATNSKNLYWIVVLNDNFDVTRNINSEGTKVSRKWNIFVNKDVTEINAVVYADGWFISADNNGIIYKDHELNKALKFKWSLFTKNTIWGSIINKLPGGKIWKYEVSRVYDLNNTRKVPVKCENGKVLDNPSFTIEYDARVQSNPPKGFSR